MVGEENVGNVMLLCFVVALARVTLNSVALGRGSHQRAAANQTDAVDCKPAESPFPCFASLFQMRPVGSLVAFAQMMA